MKSQCDVILQHLKSGKSLTPLDALRLYGCFRLAARIHDLRCAGHDIEMTWAEFDDSRVAEYYMSK